MSNMPSDDRISAYVDNRLSPEERREVDLLLESSAEAQRELADYQKLGRLLSHLPEESAADDLAPRVMAQAEQATLLGTMKPAEQVSVSRSSTRSRGWRRAIVPLMTSAVLLFTFFTMREFGKRFVEMEATPLATDSLVILNESGPLGAGVELEEEPHAVARELNTPSSLVESLDAPDSMTIELNGSPLVKVTNPQNLKTAEIGDTIEGWKFDENRIVVVQLTVVDREEVLNSMHVLLSDLSIPSEPPQEGSASAATSHGFYAVYVEADEDKMTAALKELQDDMNIEEMFVSAELPSSGLNTYFATQGYAMVDSLERGIAVPERPALTTPESASPKAGLSAVRDAQPVQPTPEKVPEPTQLSESALKETEKKVDAIKDQPTPVLGDDAQRLAAQSQSVYQPRQIQFRIPEKDGKQLIAQSQISGQPYIANSAASKMKLSKRSVAEFRKQNVAELSQEPTEPLSAGSSMARSRFTKNQLGRPVQVLFLLAPDEGSALSAPRPANE